MEELSTDPATSPPLLDISQLETFIDLGLTDFLDLLADVTRDVPEHIRKIHSAIREENGAALKTCSHGMRGMVVSFGCSGMAEYLNCLECGGVVSSALADTVRADLENLWFRSLSAIKDWERSVARFTP